MSADNREYIYKIVYFGLLVSGETFLKQVRDVLALNG